MMRRLLYCPYPFLVALLTIGLVNPCLANVLISDGSDGPFHPTAALHTVDLPPNGIFNFTNVTIPVGVTVKFNRNMANTPVFVGATGDVVIDGLIDVSAVGPPT